MQRPEFDAISNYEEFCKYYWYREELIQICKAHGLKADGGKIELNNVIRAYFSGEIIPPVKKNAGDKSAGDKATSDKSAGDKPVQERKGRNTVRKKSNPVTELTPDTGLIACGFTFGNRFRDFFSEQTGIKPFKFNVDMVATAKAVKENGDESFTLGDLLDIYYGKKSYATYDKSALQWNRFVHDFCEDEETGIYREKLKAAAALWRIVRESDMPKVYSHELLEQYKEELKNCT